MLRVHCVQLFYNLSDPGMEDLLYEVESVRRFVGLRLSGALPDETTILNFRHLLEKHGLGEKLFEQINLHLASHGHQLKTGTVVDASIITAPSSTKNRKGERGPGDAPDEEGQPVVLRDEGAYRCGRGLGFGPQRADDAGERVGRGDGARAVARGRGEQVWGDAGYQGVGKREENRDSEVDWQVAMKAGKRRRLNKAGAQEAAERRIRDRLRSKGRDIRYGVESTGKAPLRLRDRCMLPGAGEEYAAHRSAARVLPRRG